MRKTLDSIRPHLQSGKLALGIPRVTAGLVARVVIGARSRQSGVIKTVHDEPALVCASLQQATDAVRRRHPDAPPHETSCSDGQSQPRRRAPFRTSPKRQRRIDVEFESGEHEAGEHLPVVIVEVEGQRLQVVEEALARGKSSPHLAAGFVAQVQEGVKQNASRLRSTSTIARYCRLWPRLCSRW